MCVSVEMCACGMGRGVVGVCALIIIVSNKLLLCVCVRERFSGGCVSTEISVC